MLIAAFALVVLFAPAAPPTPPPSGAKASTTAAPTTAAARPRLIVLDVKVGDAMVRHDEVRALLDAIATEADRFDQVETVSLAELRAVLDLETMKQTVGCDQVGCAAEISSAFGARYVVFSSLTRVGPQWLLSLSVFDSDTTMVVGRGSLRGPTVASLSENAADIVEEALTSLGKPRPRRPKATVAPAPVDVVTPAGGAAPRLDPDSVKLTAEPLTAGALGACAYDTAADTYDCGAPTVARAYSGSASTAAVARVSADVSRGCVSAVVVELQAGDDALVVSFHEASATVDGVARPLKPELVTGVLRVPPRSLARERLLPPGGCLGATALVGTADIVTVEVPFTQAGRPAHALWVRRRIVEPADARELLAAIPEPERPAGAVDEADAPGWLATIIGGAIGVAGAVAGGGVGYALLPPSSTSDQTNATLAGCAAASGCLIGVPSIVAGVIIDGARLLTWEQAHDNAEEQRLKTKMHAAWQRRLDGVD